MDDITIVSKCSRLIQIREQKNALEKEGTSLTNELKDTLPNCHNLVIGDVILSIEDRVRTQLDIKKLCEFFQITEDALEQFKSATSYRQLTVERASRK